MQQNGHFLGPLIQALLEGSDQMLLDNVDETDNLTGD